MYIGQLIYIETILLNNSIGLKNEQAALSLMFYFLWYGFVFVLMQPVNLLLIDWIVHNCVNRLYLT